MQFLGATAARRNRRRRAVPERQAPPTAAHYRRAVRDRRRRRRTLPTSGTRPTRVAAAGRLSGPTSAPADYDRARSTPTTTSLGYVDAAVSRRRRSTAAPSAPDAAPPEMRAALARAVAHVGRFTYQPRPTGPTSGGSVQDMQTREPGRAIDLRLLDDLRALGDPPRPALDVGATTSTQWAANGRLRRNRRPSPCRRRPCRGASASERPPGGLPAGRHHLLRARGRSGRTSHSGSARRDRAVLVEPRLEHPRARGICSTDGLGAMDARRLLSPRAAPVRHRPARLISARPGGACRAAWADRLRARALSIRERSPIRGDCWAGPGPVVPAVAARLVVVAAVDGFRTILSSP